MGKAFAFVTIAPDSCRTEMALRLGSPMGANCYG